MAACRSKPLSIVIALSSNFFMGGSAQLFWENCVRKSLTGSGLGNTLSELEDNCEPLSGDKTFVCEAVKSAVFACSVDESNCR